MKKWFVKILAVLNLSEGIIHIITSLISFWGMWDIGVWDWRIAASPSFDLVLGFVSIITGFVLGSWGHHHCEDHEVQKLCRNEG